MTFTCGRGNELCVAAVHALAPLVLGKTLEDITANMAGFWRTLTSDGQLRWVGPERGPPPGHRGRGQRHLGSLGQGRGKPLWKLVVDMTPEELVRCIDFRYITDVITPDEAIALLQRKVAGKASARAEMLATAIRPTPLPPAGLATPTRRSAASAAKRWPEGGAISRSKSGATSRMTSAAVRWCGRRSGRTTSSWWMPTSIGMCPAPSRGSATSAL